MLFPSGLAVSLPSYDLRKAVLPSSIFGLDALEDIDLRAELQAAIRVVAGFCTLLGRRLVFIHRPEMFTNGDTLSWLAEKLDGIGDHLNICDGATVKLVPGMRNHLFFYLPGQQKSLNAFEKFIVRAPETMSQITYQINTTFSFNYASTLHRPQTLLLQADGHRSSEAPLEFCRFYLNRHSVEDSAARSSTLHPVGIEALRQASDIVYIAFTNSAANDILFCRMVADTILKMLALPKGHLLVLQAPAAEAAGEKFLVRVLRLLEGIRRSDVILPRAILDNVIIASNIPNESMLGTTLGHMRLVIPDSFDAWAYPRNFWAMFSKVTLLLPRFRRRDKLAIVELLTDVMGYSPEIVWTLPKDRGSLYAKLKDA